MKHIMKKKSMKKKYNMKGSANKNITTCFGCKEDLSSKNIHRFLNKSFCNKVNCQEFIEYVKTKLGLKEMVVGNTCSNMIRKYVTNDKELKKLLKEFNNSSSSSRVETNFNPNITSTSCCKSCVIS